MQQNVCENKFLKALLYSFQRAFVYNNYNKVKKSVLVTVT